MIASFGVTFGLTYLMMAGQPDPELVFDMYGGYLVTTILTTSLNWHIGNSLFLLKVLLGRVSPVDPSCLSWWPDASKSSGYFRWFLRTSDLVLCPPTENGSPRPSFPTRLCNHWARMGVWILYGLVTIFPIYCILTGYVFWGSEGFNDFPQPQIAISIYASLVSATTIPIWVIITLGDTGSRLLEPKSSSQNNWK
jgi:hypothetical protein